MTSVELRRKTSRPPSRRRRAASGIQRYGSTQIEAPYSETTRSALASGRPVSAASASTRGNSMPVLAIIRRAVSSCAGVTSTPTGRAPFFASQAEKYAVPQPSSTTSLPSTSPRTFRSDSSIPQMPHEISSSAQFVSAFSSVYSAFAFVQRVTFFAASSDEAIGEPDPDLALGGLRRVGAVHEVVRHGEREAAAQRARRGLGRVGRADRDATGRDRPFALEDERERRPGGDEVDELAEERLLLVLGVVRLADLARRRDQARGAQLQPAPLEGGEDLAGEVALDGVRLRENQSALDGHAAAETTENAGGVAGASPRKAARRRRRARSASRRTGRP